MTHKTPQSADLFAFRQRVCANRSRVWQFPEGSVAVHLQHYVSEDAIHGHISEASMAGLSQSEGRCGSHLQMTHFHKMALGFEHGRN